MPTTVLSREPLGKGYPTSPQSKLSGGTVPFVWHVNDKRYRAWGNVEESAQTGQSRLVNPLRFAAQQPGQRAAADPSPVYDFLPANVPAPLWLLFTPGLDQVNLDCHLLLHPRSFQS